MSDIGALSQDEQIFLRPYLPPNACQTSAHETGIQDAQPPQTRAAPKSDDLPFVTLTYACSLDSMIALAPGARTTLSGPETKTMTHYLRLCHDAILIGAGTAAVDDPGLNCRYPGATLQDQPQPVIVDPNGRWDAKDKKACRLAIEGSGKGPWIVARRAGSSHEYLRKIGGDYLLIEDDAPNSQIPWLHILRSLKSKGIRSVMIEGGANVINTLLTHSDLVDAVIVTIAPTFLGQGGVAVSPAPQTSGMDNVDIDVLAVTGLQRTKIVYIIPERHISKPTARVIQTILRQHFPLRMADDKDLGALGRINNSLIAHDPSQSLPVITLADGSKVQTGTVGALMQNIKLYDRIVAGESIEGLDKETLEQMMVPAIPTLKKSGLLDVFPSDAWIAGPSAGQRFVGAKAKEMGY